jgi:hypothetical protein
LGAKEEHFEPRAGGVFTFRIKGALHHRIGTLLPSEGNTPHFPQLYINDPQDRVAQLNNRMDLFLDERRQPLLDLTILNMLQNCLADVNPYV